MARKSKKSQRPEHPGRFIPGYAENDAHWGERIVRELDDAGVRAMGEAAKKLLADIALKEAALAESKREIAGLKRQEAECVRAMVERREDRRHEGPVYLYANDEAGTVDVYDAKTDALLCTREINDYERQESMDLDGDGAEGEDDGE